MLKKFILLIVVVIEFPSLGQGLSLIEAKPKNITVQEGDNVTFYCHVDDEFQWCTFQHNDKNCDRLWYNHLLGCNDYRNRKATLVFWSSILL